METRAAVAERRRMASQASATTGTNARFHMLWDLSPTLLAVLESNLLLAGLYASKAQLLAFLLVQLLLCCNTVSVAAWSGPQYVCGQRCFWVKASSSASSSRYPPLVLVGGLGQTIASYESHLPYLSKNRNVLVYECLGQGFPEITTTKHVYSNVTLPFQAERLLTTVQKVIGHDEFDFVGYSLGARIGMAASIISTDVIRRLHLSGISTKRSLQGEVALESWKSMTRDDNLQGFAWSALQTTYSPSFLHANRHRLAAWVQHLCHSNSAAGLQALLEQAYPSSLDDSWHVCNMATRIKQKGRILVGQDDVMALSAQTITLASLLRWEPPLVIPGCGHAVPMEHARTWQKDVLEFLDQ
jgi:pimeloyl-ACP methyl ester carboxylesterase